MRDIVLRIGSTTISVSAREFFPGFFFFLEKDFHCEFFFAYGKTTEGKWQEGASGSSK